MKRTSGLWTIQLPGGGSPPPPPPRETVYTVAPLLRPPRYVIYVANREGQFIGELTSWGYLEALPAALDNYTTTGLNLSERVQTAAPHLLEPGNPVLVVFDNGLPPWGGVLDPPENVRDGTLRLAFYSAEYLMSWYKTPLRSQYPLVYRDRPEAILRDLVESATWDGLNMLLPDEVRDYGQAINISFTLQTLQSAANALTDRAPDMHWRVRPALRSDRSGFDFRLEIFRGGWRDMTGKAVLVRGLNFAGVEFLGDGPIVNWLAVDMPNRTMSDSASIVMVEDATSSLTYGRRWDMRTVSEEEAAVDLTGQYLTEEAQEIAAAEFARTAHPARRVRGTYINLPPARYGSFDLGDLITVELGGLRGVNTATGLVTVLQYDPMTGAAEVVVELQRQGSEG